MHEVGHCHESRRECRRSGGRSSALLSRFERTDAAAPNRLIATQHRPPGSTANTCGMILDEIAAEAAAHRAAVVALLGSHLPVGERGPAARAVGVGPAYLSRVLSEQTYSVGALRKPRLEPLRPGLASELAKWLRLDTRSRDQLLDHARLSHESHIKACLAIKSMSPEPDVSLPELLNVYAAANQEPDPILSSVLRAMSHRFAEQLFKCLPPRVYPLEFAQVCLVLNDLEAVLNNNVDGIYYARLAQNWMALLPGTKESQLLVKDAHVLLANALIAEAVSTHNLGLDKKAHILSRRILARRMNNIWSGEAALNMRKCTSIAGRTSASQVDALVDQYLEVVCKVGSSMDAETSSFAFFEAKLRAYISCSPTKRSVKKAAIELERCLSQIEFDGSEEERVLAFVNKLNTPGRHLRSVIFLNTYSRFLEMRGDHLRAERVRGEAESRAERAGLAHQLARMRAASAGQ